MNVRELKHEESCTEILEAAAQAIARHGYHGMSMRKLAQATGRSLAGFYCYFESKEDVLFEIQCRAFETLRVSAGAALALAEGPAEQLYAFALNHVRYFAAHRDTMRVLIHESSALPPARRRKVREAKEEYFAIGRSIIARIAEQGCGKTPPAGERPDPLEIERSTYAVFGMLNWIYGWYDPQRHGEPAEIARSIQRLALCGLVARCPHARPTERLDKRLAECDLMPLLGPA